MVRIDLAPIRIWVQFQWNWHLQIFKKASRVPNLIMLWKQHRKRKMFLIFRYKRIEISSKKWKKKCTLLPLPHIGPVSDSSHPQSPQLKIFYSSQIVLFLQEMSLKGNVSWDRFQKCGKKFTELGLNTGRGWCLNFSEAPLIFYWHITYSLRLMLKSRRLLMLSD